MSEIGVSVPWAEAVDLVDQIAARPGTHYWSALQGFTGPTSYPDLATILHAQAFLNRYRPKGTDPVKLPLPIPDAKPESDVTPEERDELIAYARATAPFSLDD